VFIFSEEFKSKMVTKLLSPGGPYFKVSSEEIGVLHIGLSMTKKTKLPANLPLKKNSRFSLKLLP
jgi:hypothetical protein